MQTVQARGYFSISLELNKSKSLKKFSESSLIWNPWLTEKAFLYVWLPLTQLSALPSLKTLTQFWIRVGIGHMCKCIRTCTCVPVNLHLNIPFNKLDDLLLAGDCFFSYDYFLLLELDYRLTFKTSQASRNPVFSNTFKLFCLWPFPCASPDPFCHYNYCNYPPHHTSPTPKSGEGTMAAMKSQEQAWTTEIVFLKIQGFCCFCRSVKQEAK